MQKLPESLWMSNNVETIGDCVSQLSRLNQYILQPIAEGHKELSAGHHYKAKTTDSDTANKAPSWFIYFSAWAAEILFGLNKATNIFQNFSQLLLMQSEC